MAGADGQSSTVRSGHCRRQRAVFVPYTSCGASTGLGRTTRSNIDLRRQTGEGLVGASGRRPVTVHTCHSAGQLRLQDALETFSSPCF